jgi:non-specific serine/threonine protein kinase
MEEALEASGTDYNVYVPILNAMSALGKADAARNVRLRLIQALENSPARGAGGRAGPDPPRRHVLARKQRVEDAMRETNLAMVLRPNEATVLYNAACTFTNLGRRTEAGKIRALLSKAWEAGTGRRVDAARPRPGAAAWRRPGVSTGCSPPLKEG